MSQLFCFDVNQVGGAVAIILHLCVSEADRPDKENFTSAQGSPKQGVTGTICFKMSKNQLEMCGKKV